LSALMTPWFTTWMSEVEVSSDCLICIPRLCTPLAVGLSVFDFYLKVAALAIRLTDLSLLRWCQE
jgi:hypothetical protein